MSILGDLFERLRPRPGCTTGRAWYERPARLVRDADGRVTGAQPARLVKLCPRHVERGDALQTEAPPDGRCGHSLNLPPPGGIFIIPKRRKKPDGRRR